MKNLIKSVLVILIGLTSCQKDNIDPTPDPKQATEAGMRESALPSTTPKYYKLVKDGNVKIAYDQSGRISKVTYQGAQRGKLGPSGTYVVYKYGAHQISSIVYYNNFVYQRSTYLLDNAGRCYESTQLDYSNAGANAFVEKESSFTYQYNATGRLITRTNKKLPTEKTTFGWNASGDMIKITGTDFNSGRAYEPTQANITLAYERLAGDPMLDNLLPINGEASNLPDDYLPIFGKKSLHLVTLVTDQPSQFQKYYNYVVNADSYPTQRDTYQMAGAKLIESKSYDYLVTEIGLHL